jgi:hypothetical protein
MQCLFGSSPTADSLSPDRHPRNASPRFAPVHSPIATSLTRAIARSTLSISESEAPEWGSVNFRLSFYPAPTGRHASYIPSIVFIVDNRSVPRWNLSRQAKAHLLEAKANLLHLPQDVSLAAVFTSLVGGQLSFWWGQLVLCGTP